MDTNKKYFIKFLLVLFAVLLINLILGKLIPDNSIRTNSARTAYIVTPIKRNFIGYVISQNSLSLSFRTEGNIIFCPYTQGDKIKKGILLAQNDGDTYIFKLNEEIEKLRELKIKSARIDKYYKRMNILHNSGAISDNDWEEAFYGAKTAKKEIEIQNEVVRQIEEKISYTKIYAPYDGYILKRILDKGEYATAGETVLILNNSEYTQVETMADFKIQSKIKINDEVKITKNNKIYLGHVKHISSSSLNQGGYLIKIYLDKNYPELKEGENVQVEYSNLEPEKIYIPLSFLQKDKENNFINKINKNKIEKIPVKTGNIIEYENKILIEILDNLKIGDEIIEF